MPRARGCKGPSHSHHSRWSRSTVVTVAAAAAAAERDNKGSALFKEELVGNGRGLGKVPEHVHEDPRHALDEFRRHDAAAVGGGACAGESEQAIVEVVAAAAAAAAAAVEGQQARHDASVDKEVAVAVVGLRHGLDRGEGVCFY
jgi:hypothetical protein